MQLFAHGPSDATAIPRPQHFLPHLNPFLYQLTQIVLEKRLLNGYIVTVVNRVQKKVVHFVLNITLQVQARFSYNF